MAIRTTDELAVRGCVCHAEFAQQTLQLTRSDFQKVGSPGHLSNARGSCPSFRSREESDRYMPLDICSPDMGPAIWLAIPQRCCADADRHTLMTR